jgi:glycosyltransferase involved in cell wall biosynthesis
VQEALASGLPVVCGTETLEADPELGTLVQGIPIYANDDRRTASECLFAIESAVKSNAQSSNVSEMRHAFAATHYSWQYAINRYVELASHVMPAKRNPEATMGADT